MELDLGLPELQGDHKPGRHAQVVGVPPELVAPGWAPSGIFFHQYFYVFHKNSP